MTAPTAADLAAVLGVTLGRPRLHSKQVGDQLLVGSVIVRDDGTVRAHPCIDLDDDESRAWLLGVATTIAVHGRHAMPGDNWRNFPKLGGWAVGITRPCWEVAALSAAADLQEAQP
ncbi:MULTISPECIES: hypothetical protein [Nocardia]|uniref:hypothetical protein n=1 Tax=Nocardia TaxID=1817 RepID=UPI002453771F|nr:MULTISPECIES: hypothetical protein [Nocardia]